MSEYKIDVKEDYEFRKSPFLRDIVIGMSDGLIIPFVIAAGLTVIYPDGNNILIVGLITITIGALIMGLGAHYSGKAEQQLYIVEDENALLHRHTEFSESKEFFANIGLSEEIQEEALEEIAEDKKRWQDFTQRYELDYKKQGAIRTTAFTIAISYAIAGLIPLLPYLFIENAKDAFQYSAIITIICLLVFGYTKSFITQTIPIWGAFRLAGIGTVAAAGAIFIAKIFAS